RPGARPPTRAAGVRRPAHLPRPRRSPARRTRSPPAWCRRRTRSAGPCRCRARRRRRPSR
ncbi:MAG: signal recognition particle protein, partial [Gemmatimonadetes bacterium]|nr:signal recognition particle protein [Gemmatimonadota bacterium]